MTITGAATTRSLVPRLPEPLVHRRRLEALLTDGLVSDLVVVSAPPGAGKTTLLASWLEHVAAGPVTWRTVEARDNNGARFAQTVLEALAEIGGVPPTADGPHGRGIEALEAALSDIDYHTPSGILILDDVHELTAPDAIGCLEYLVDHTPPLVKIVISTRADPPLRIGRLRANGRMREIRNDELMFRESEAAELFNAHGLHVSRSETTAIHELTEGWAG